MRATVTWKGVGGMAFEGRTEDGHAVSMDGPPELGGKGDGARPMELVLLGTGGCSGVAVVHILKKGRHAVHGCRVELEAERATREPTVFTRIHLHFVVVGRDLKPKDVQRAVDLTADKYCPASIMLARSAAITHDFEIIEA